MLHARFSVILFCTMMATGENASVNDVTENVGTTFVVERSNLRVFFFLILLMPPSFAALIYLILLPIRFAVGALDLSTYEFLAPLDFFCIGVMALFVPLIFSRFGHSMFGQRQLAILTPDGLQLPTLGHDTPIPWSKVVYFRAWRWFRTDFRVVADPDEFSRLPFAESMRSTRKRQVEDGKGIYIEFADVMVGGRVPFDKLLEDYIAKYGEATM